MDKTGKNFKIFGVRSDLLGDVIMSLPVLNYLEKIHHNSYKYFHLAGKCAQIAPLLLNHPLIDKIKISRKPETYDSEDLLIMQGCQLVINTRPEHKDEFWYNKFNCVEETVRMAGINLDHFNSILNEDEKRPKLEKWFNTGLFDSNSVGYCKEGYIPPIKTKNIAIKPFSGYGLGSERSPSVTWWRTMVQSLIDGGYRVSHYGFPNESVLSNNENYRKLTDLSFFDQIKSALDSDAIIGNDDGFMWIMGAYDHPAIHLLTFWQKNHFINELAFAPHNKNAKNIFNRNGCSYITKEEIINNL